MKAICTLLLTTALGAVGCTTTSNSITGDKYAADEPLVEKGGDLKAPAESASSYNPPVSRVDPDAIDVDTAHDAARRLQSDLKTDRGATAKAGR
jgi:hypothetical protein